jgi:hypothetical protein
MSSISLYVEKIYLKVRVKAIQKLNKNGKEITFIILKIISGNVRVVIKFLAIH